MKFRLKLKVYRSHNHKHTIPFDLPELDIARGCPTGLVTSIQGYQLCDINGNWFVVRFATMSSDYNRNSWRDARTGITRIVDTYYEAKNFKDACGKLRKLYRATETRPHR